MIMSIDKTWITNRNRRSPEYEQGLTSFIEMCKEHLDSRGYVRCACAKCQNTLLIPFIKMKFHMHAFGICRTYTKWTYHGESLVPAVLVVDDVAPTNDMVGVSEKAFGVRRKHTKGIEQKPSSCTLSSSVSPHEQQQTPPLLTQAQFANMFQDASFREQLSQFIASDKASKKGDGDDTNEGTNDDILWTS